VFIYDHIKLKFYRTLYSRSKASNSELVCLELFGSYCPPFFLLYAVESTGPSRKAVRMLNRCIDSTVMKIFKLTSLRILPLSECV